MKAGSPRSWIALAATVAGLALLALACTRGRTPAGPEPSAALPTSPLGAVESLAACWSRRDLDRYELVLWRDFAFTSWASDTIEPAPFLDRLEELAAVERMWRTGGSGLLPATSITFHLMDPTEVDRFPDPAVSSVLSDAEVTVRTPGAVYWVVGRYSFRLVRTDSTSRGDTTRTWHVHGWHEIGVGPDTLGASPGQSSLWNLKQDYLGR